MKYSPFIFPLSHEMSASLFFNLIIAHTHKTRCLQLEHFLDGFNGKLTSSLLACEHRHTTLMECTTGYHH